MQNRAEIVNEQFIKRVKEHAFPAAKTPLPTSLALTKEEMIDLFESQITSRHLDITSRALRARNESFYTIGSCGHEGNAAIAKALRCSDMAFLHYRSGAFFVQRAKQLFGSTPIYDLLLSFAASSDDPIASGRHKVFGSWPLFIPPQTSTIASHVPKSVGAALSVTKASKLGIDAELPGDSVVMCSFGDASLNHSTTQGALQSAEWSYYQGVRLPLIFVCEDNGLGISVSTPQGWVQHAMQHRKGILYIACDGLNVFDTYQKALQAQNIARQKQRPVFLHMKTVRLLGHAGSDVETEYLTPEAIEQTEGSDPLLHTARMLIELNVLSADAIVTMYQNIATRVAAVAEVAIKKPKQTTAKQIMADIIPRRNLNNTALPSYYREQSRPACLNRSRPACVNQEVRENTFGREAKLFTRPHHMAKLLNWALTDIMMQYSNAVVFGEDVAQKGGVYHVTTGLWKRFGSQRVFNSLLDEQSILGTAIGLAHNGFLPIPEIQFLAYLHNAEDQLRGEASTLSFFSSSQYTNPMVIRIAGLAYQKGFGGHFHNDNSFAVLRDIPGVVIACPSNGLDAVKMLRRCVALAYEERRVCVFLEPIALYMTKHLQVEGDKAWSFVYPEPDVMAEFGQCAVYGESETLAIISYGNGHYLSTKAAKVLQDKHNITCKQIDLRWLAPLDEAGIIDAVKSCKHVLIVDECRKTGSISEALMTLCHERLSSATNIKRLTAQDSFIPLADAANLVLPSEQEIIDIAVEMVNTQKKPLRVIQ